MKTNKDEKEILDSVERGEWRTIPDLEKESDRYQKYARSAFRKDKRINIRISEKDLVKLQRRAVKEGLPYQTLISSILHKFVSGQFQEKPSG
ncbi:MAG: antitoxin [Candidatus Aminicenantes bacterium]|nr:antitoxin [Candidatus Aminicenantes bacterium]